MGYGATNSWKVLLAMAMLVLPAMAQLQLGDDLKMNMTANITAGYGGSMGDAGVSAHSLTFGGNGQLNGSIYDPKFISFSALPYYNRSQNNSDFQLVNNNKGLTSEISFFSGSHFPGSFSFMKQDDNTGTLGLPGTSGLATNGSSRFWNLSWSALLPDLPTLTVSFAKSTNSSQVFGTNENNDSGSRSFTLDSTYSIAGFSLRGNFQDRSTALNSAGFLSAQGISLDSESDSKILQFTANHRLPMNGTWMSSASRFQGKSAFLGQGSESTTHIYSSNASILPWKRMSLNGGVTYSDNLSGSLNQKLIEQGAAPIFSAGDGTSNSLNIYGSASVQVLRSLAVTANANHIVQRFGGVDFSISQYSGSVSYNVAHEFLGSLSFNGGVIDTANQLGNSGVGLFGNANFSRKFGHWTTNANIGYSQNVETLLAVYTTSSYNYGANIGRRFANGYHLSSYFSGSHSGFQKQAGNQSHAETFGSTVGTRHYSASGNWGQSMGLAVITATGLVATDPNSPIAILSPDSIITFGGSHYGFGGTYSGFGKMTIFGNYSNSNSSTIAGLKTTLGNTSMLSTTLRYPVRKMVFEAQYSRLGQTVGTPGSSPVMITSYSFGISRWFNIF